jgi:DNA-binding MarR family transcriptional regulator
MESTYSQRYINKYGVYKGRGRMTPRSLDIARSVVMNPGVSYIDIARDFGVTKQRVGQIVRRMNVARTRKIGIDDG